MTHVLSQRTASATPDAAETVSLTLAQRINSYSRIAAAAVIIVAVTVLVGWILGIEELTEINPNWASMKFNTATCFLLSAIGLRITAPLAGDSLRRWWAFPFALMAVVIAVATLCEYAFDVDLGIDDLVVSDAGSGLSGRMSEITAINFTLLGLALIAIAVGGRWGPLAAQGLAAPILATATVASLGYWYGVESLYDVEPFSSVAVLTAICFVILSTGVFAARADRGVMSLLSGAGVGSSIARRLFPVIVLLPALGGYFSLLGERADLWGLEFAFILLVMVTISTIFILVYGVSFSLNSTDAKRLQAEDDLRSLNVSLEARVAERTAELETAMGELEAFSYSVAHDLRAPLRGIDGFGEALEEDYGDILDEQASNYLRRMRVSTRRMGELIDSLLSLSRISRMEILKSDVDLSEIANSILAGLQEANAGRQAEVVVTDGLRAYGDERLLRAALENLLSNAWKFTRDRQPARIEFGITQIDEDRVFMVRDNGAGFDMKHVGNLFTPFQRLHSVDEFEGTGVGLATVHRIVSRHGGKIWAEGVVGEGTTFYFTL